MPATTKLRVVRFVDWSGGEFGDLGAANAPPNTFTAKNMMVYKNGRIGPRPGLKNLSVNGVATGTVWGFTGGGTGTNGLVFGVSTSVYGFTSGVGNTVSTYGTVSTTYATVQFQQVYDTVTFVVYGGDPWYVTPPSTLTQITDADAPGGLVHAQFGDRWFIANKSGATERVYYSNANDWTTWVATSYFDVGYAPISYLEDLRSRLVIAEVDGSWWALSGTVELDSVLRRTPREDVIPSNWYNATRLGETVYFAPLGLDYPVVFTGAVTDKLRYQYLSFSGGGEISAASIPSENVVAFIEKQASGGGRMLVLVNDVWSFHTVENSIKTSVFNSRVGAGVTPSSNPLVLCDGGSASTKAKFYAFHPYLDRPGKTGDTYAQPGDDSTTPLSCYLYTPEWWAQDGSVLAVRAVRIDFAKWNTGSSSTNHFDVSVRSLHRPGQTGTKDSATQSFDEATSSTPADETLDTRTFRFGDQGAAHGFQILLDNIRGVAIDQIIVEIDVDPSRK